MNANHALAQVLKNKDKGFPQFKNSKLAKQSFIGIIQGYQTKEHSNPRFKIFKLMNIPFKMFYHKEFPKEYKLIQIIITKNYNKYYYFKY